MLDLAPFTARYLSLTLMVLGTFVVLTNGEEWNFCYFQVSCGEECTRLISCPQLEDLQIHPDESEAKSTMILYSSNNFKF